jgi:hypothetical protein
LFEIKAGITNANRNSIDWHHSKWYGEVGRLTGSWEKQLKDIEKERLPLLRLSTIWNAW